LNNDLNNINIEISQLKENMKKLDGINLEDLSKFDPNKINILIQECEEIKSNNPKTYENLKKYDDSIMDLNNKLNKLNEDYENQTNKRFNEINDKISKLKEHLNSVSNENNIENPSAKKEEDNSLKQRLDKMEIKIINIESDLKVIKEEDDFDYSKKLVKKKNVNNVNDNNKKEPKRTLPVPPDDSDDESDNELSNFEEV